MFGISDFSFAIPSCYIPIQDFAEHKNINYTSLKSDSNLHYDYTVNSFVCQFNLQKKLDDRMKISFETYKEYRFCKTTKVGNAKGSKDGLHPIGIEELNFCSRKYKYVN